MWYSLLLCALHREGQWVKLPGGMLARVNQALPCICARHHEPADLIHNHSTLEVGPALMLDARLQECAG